ncbi:MAG: endonuclease III [Acholeplasmataceae bacterium]|jgi:endonuclease-3
MKKKELIIRTLNEMFPNPKSDLNYTNHFEMLIAVVLSAQTTDVSVNKVTPILFSKYPNPKALMDADILELEDILKSIGLYKTKARNIKNLSKILHDKFNSEIPSKREDLESLPGVGRKTANVVLANAFNRNVIAVDTHVNRVSKRLGIACESDNILQVENKIVKYFAKDDLKKLHHQLIFFGRYHCLARSPKCENCPLQNICTYYKTVK